MLGIGHQFPTNAGDVKKSNCCAVQQGRTTNSPVSTSKRKLSTNTRNKIRNIVTRKILQNNTFKSMRVSLP